MTDHDFIDLTPPINLWDGTTQNQKDCIFAAARWGAEQAAERLRGQWPEPIKDRPPTEKDADDAGYVQVQALNGRWSHGSWGSAARSGYPWRHTPQWQPPATPTLKEQALATVKYGLAGETLSFEALELIRRALEQLDD